MPRRPLIARDDAPVDPEALIQQVRRLLAEAQALSARLAALNEVAAALQRCENTDDIVQLLAREARWLLDFQICSLALRDGEVYHERSVSNSMLPPNISVAQPLQVGLIGRALVDGQAQLVAELAAGDGPAKMRSALLVPLRSAGQILGALTFFAHAPSCYALDDLRIAHALAIQVVARLQNIQARNEIEQLRDEMISMLVHDLRTPLTGMMMGMDMMKLFYDEGNQQEFVEVYVEAQDSANRLLQRINTLLDMRRIEAGSLELGYEYTSPLALLETVLAPYYSVAAQSQQRLLLRRTAELPMISVDLRMIERVVENLLGNALKFTPPGGQITVEARYNAEHDQLVISVADDGPGVPENMRLAIFQRYIQVPGQKARQGSGIGLAFCRMAVEAHGGSIAVHPREEGGSIFAFSLPCHTSR